MATAVQKIAQTKIACRRGPTDALPRQSLIHRYLSLRFARRRPANGEIVSRFLKQLNAFMNDIVEYRGFIIFWQQALSPGKWSAGVTSACPSLFPASLYGCVHGDAPDAVLANAKARIDGMLDGLRAA
jgi:hypothetical protein